MSRFTRLLLLSAIASLVAACGQEQAGWGSSSSSSVPADTVAPTRPSGLVGTTMGSSGASLTWNASTDNVAVVSYVVTRNGASIASTSATSFVDSGLAPSTTYAYAVAAMDAAGNQSASSQSVSITTTAVQPPDTTPPSQPGNFTAVAAGTSAATLSWSASIDNVGVTGYILTRNGTQIATPAGTSFSDTGLTASTTYAYTVVARDAAGNRSAAANASVTTAASADTTPPTQPANFAGASTGPTAVSLSWTASTDNVGVIGYVLTRNGTQIATPAGTSFSDTGLAASTTYAYTLVARDAAGNRSTTASASVTTAADTTPPTQPGNFSASATGATTVRLSWTASTDNVGVTGYIVTRDGNQVATPTGTSFSDTGLTASTTYSYTVVARDAAGNRSTAASAGVATPAPPVTKTVDLSWDPVTAPNLTGYRVYYGTASRTYIQPFGLGLGSATNSFSVSGLVSGNRYFFAVTAIDSQGNESGYSNEGISDIP